MHTRAHSGARSETCALLLPSIKKGEAKQRGRERFLNYRETADARLDCHKQPPLSLYVSLLLRWGGSKNALTGERDGEGERWCVYTQAVRDENFSNRILLPPVSFTRVRSARFHIALSLTAASAIAVREPHVDRLNIV